MVRCATERMDCRDCGRSAVISGKDEGATWPCLCGGQMKPGVVPPQPTLEERVARLEKWVDDEDTCRLEQSEYD